MPRIPTFKTRPVEANVQFAQVPVGAVRLSTGSVQQALGNVGGAISRTPKVQAEDFSGLIALGKGISDVGRYTAEIAHQEQQLTNAHEALKFQNSTAEADAEIRGLMETEADPDEMQRKVAEVIARTQSSIDFGKADNHQKELLASGMERFTTNARIEAKYGATKIKQRNFRNDFAATRNLAIANEDTNMLAGAYQAQLVAGEITPVQLKASIALDGIQMRAVKTRRVYGEIQADLQKGDFTAARVKWGQTWGTIGEKDTPEEQYMKSSIEAQIGKAEVVQAFTRSIEEDPDKYAIELGAVDEKNAPKNYQEMTWLERQNYMEFTKKVQLRNSVQATHTAMDDIASGKIKTFDQIRAVKGLQPRDWVTLGRMLSPTPPSAEVWGSTTRSILNLPVSSDDEGKMNQQLWAIQQAHMWPESSPERKLIMELVTDKFKDHSADASTDDAAKTWIREQLAAGYLGGAKEPYNPGTKGWQKAEGWGHYTYGEIPGSETQVTPKEAARIAALKEDKRKGVLVKTQAGFDLQLKNTIILNEERERLNRIPGATPDSVLKGVQAKAASLGTVDALAPKPTVQLAPDASPLPALTPEQMARAQAIQTGKK
jgi:hypothetical protein